MGLMRLMGDANHSASHHFTIISFSPPLGETGRGFFYFFKTAYLVLEASLWSTVSVNTESP